MRRVELMSIAEYEQFELCRSATLLSKGKKQFQKYLNLAFNSDLDLEHVAFALKFILKSCVELSILSSVADETFNCVNRPISLAVY